MFSTLLTQDITVLRRTKTKDGGGGWKISWAINEVLKGRFRYLRARESKISDQDRAVVLGRVYLEAGEDVLKTDRLEIDGDKYTIGIIENPMSMDHHLEIDVALYNED